ncbi:MAG: hypothetical protein PHO63_06260, partial [Bacilli bacterium]|nr:hypothetical protein [Bacilli bacterium]
MNIIDWIKWAFGKKDSITLNSCGFGEIATEIAYKEVALNKVVNMIANSLCNCEFKTFKENNTKGYVCSWANLNMFCTKVHTGIVIHRINHVKFQST